MDETTRTPTHHTVVVIGGGNAGLSVAGRLRRKGIRDVAVIEPRAQHVFAPLQSYIAGGAARASQAVRPQGDVTPPGVTWVRDTVTRVSPDAHTVTLASGEVLSYEQLIVASGIELRWDAVPGLAEAMRLPTGLSSYTFELSAKTSPALRDFRSGTVVFVQPPEPATNAPVAQKPMYLSADWWRRRGALDRIRVLFVSPEGTAHPVPQISAELQRKIDEYGIETRYGADLLEVDPHEHKVLIGRDDVRERVSYDLLFVVPPQSGASWIAESGLASPTDSRGFVDVDRETMQHRSYPDVWSLGDAASLDTLRSGGGIRPQAKMLVQNLLAHRAGRPLKARYDGYTATPITVSRREVVFGEFDRDGVLQPTVPFWRSLYKARRLTWLLDRHVLPWVYWHLILRGRA